MTSQSLNIRVREGAENGLVAGPIQRGGLACKDWAGGIAEFAKGLWGSG